MNTDEDMKIGSKGKKGCPKVRWNTRFKTEKNHAFGSLLVEPGEMFRPIESSAYGEFCGEYAFETQYWISNHGRVFSAISGKILKPSDAGLDNERRVFVDLTGKNGQCKTYVHKLVAAFFCANQRKKTVIHHIDGKHRNNNACNLLWVTGAEHTLLHRLMKNDLAEYEKMVTMITQENMGMIIEIKAGES